MLGPEFADALTYTYELHATHRRKGPNGPPYLGHLLAVTGTVIDEGGSEEEAIAALLHDAAEDQGGEARLDKIERRFGPKVASIVRECSDTTADDKEPWADRKDAYIAGIATKSPEALRVTLADKLHNAGAIVRDHREHGDALWDRFSADKEDVAGYYRRLATAFEARIGELEQRYPHFSDFEAAVSMIEQAAGIGAAAV